MSKLIGLLSLMVLALLPANAWACGDDGQSPCGGSCNWIAKGYCPFCIPWCSRDPHFCHAGNQLKTEYAFLWLTGEVVETQVCRATATPPPQVVTVNQALAAGCRGKADIDTLVSQTLARSDLGTTTRTKLSSFSGGDGWATRVDVTDPDTWGYRAATIGGEEAKLTAGQLTSKSERRLSRWTGTPAEFWASYGPQVNTSQRDATSLSLQMLATSSSDEPPSQFVSVALDYAVASGFGNVVYRFQLNPQSPLLGLRDCKMAGEVQIQPPGGTPIRNLQRFDKTKGYWEKYQAGVWVKMDKDEL
ncbi:hypothetical protein [Pyxidicoccus caerfyrddinensis]|uniref:hypothetical protein n=1 Tax=Pyxidicoccus caerfyrddinensis TaxID=2709663 RepID=UPI0013DD7D98|nr:hypothetical protein [Pyxidicoccus caerfyrddinensis]